MSIEAQSQEPTEIIISDNASTDHTSKIAEEWANKLPNCRYLKQPTNIGALANMLFLAEACKGDYFLWLAADDVLEPQCIETIHAFVQKHPECGMVGWAHTTYNFSTCIRSVGDTFPDVKFSHTHYQNSRNYVKNPISSYFYSLFKRQYILSSAVSRWHCTAQAFDWMDCTFVLDSLLKVKAHFLRENLTTFGVDTEIRPKKTPNGETAPLHYHYRGKTWLAESMKIILSATTITPLEKTKLLVNFWNTWRSVTQHVQNQSEVTA